MLALNFQTNGLPMSMNQTLFEENGRSGYVLKAKCLREKAFKMSVHDSHIFVANRLEIEVTLRNFQEFILGDFIAISNLNSPQKIGQH